MRKPLPPGALPNASHNCHVTRTSKPFRCKVCNRLWGPWENGGRKRIYEDEAELAEFFYDLENDI